MPTIEIELRDINIVPKQSFRVGRNGHSYQTKKIIDNKKAIVNSTHGQLYNKRLYDLVKKYSTYPVSIEIQFYYPYPKSWPSRKKTPTQYKMSRPDLDNLEKQICDSLEGLLYVNDSQIVNKISCKKYYTLNYNSIFIILTYIEV